MKLPTLAPGLAGRSLLLCHGLLLLLAGCGEPDISISKLKIDADNDGYDEEVDCDDSQYDVNPDAPEMCDGVDNDCDKEIDEDANDAPTWYLDLDHDGFGDPSTALRACEQPEGAIEDGTDCDDTEPASFPGNPEICDGIDNDCDLRVDIDAIDELRWFLDNDEDNYGDSSLSLDACDAPEGYVTSDRDCDDTNPDIHPDAPETDCADPTDYNCDGSVEYEDADSDGWAACEDCDDTNRWANPGATELCDDDYTDEDCDGLINDDDTEVDHTTTWYRDRDSDGYAPTGASTVELCEQPAGYVTLLGDCNDFDAAISPSAREVCDEADIDEDCNGLADDGDPMLDASTWTAWFADRDGDTYGDSSRRMDQCEQPTSYVRDASDCDDGNVARNPGATEVCDSADVDEDCDGFSDDDDPSVTGTTTWYLDYDHDSYGSTSAVSACELPSGYAANDDDCDDRNSAVNPAAIELCDSANVDEDCDGLADDADASVSGRSTWYRDLDSDGYAGSTTTSACDALPGYYTTSTDCDDGNSAIYPGATEYCDTSNTDEDCDGLADDADTYASGKTTWYRDADLDSYGGTTSTSACDAPSGYVANHLDCNDAASSISPAATELCDAADVDEDCDGLADDSDSSASGKSTFYRDADVDTYGSATAYIVRCDILAGYVTNDDDCDDGSALVTLGNTWYRDADTDGWGNAGISAVGCAAPSGYVANDDDCDDTRASLGAPATWYLDVDLDTYGVGTVTTTSCVAPTGYAGVAGDCNDAASAINPGATELCDLSNVDEDCDGQADDSDASATGKSSVYIDSDSDTYGNPLVSLLRCDPLSGYVSNDDDCDDTSAAITLGATWYRDGDSDSWGNAADSMVACSLPGGYVSNSLDCDDTRSAVGAASTWYRDLDTDGYGLSGYTTTSCTAPSGYAALAGDCDDSSASISPAATELCDAANVDEDCDSLADDSDTYASGKSLWYLDADLDTFGSTTSLSRCDRPAGYVSDSTDCDDTHVDAYPGGTEVCGDGIDQDCSGGDLECEIPGYYGVYPVNDEYNTKVYGLASNDRFAYAMITGDFDGDNHGDLLVGAPFDAYSSSYPDYGVGYLYYGPTAEGAWSATAHDDVLFYNSSSTWAGLWGSRLANLGDLDADGDDELAFIVSGTTTRMYAYYGGDTGVQSITTYDFMVSNCAVATGAGQHDAITGQEWICADPSATSSAGSLSVYSGPGTTSLLSTIQGESSGDQAGYAVASAQDVDGDGTDDLWIGAPYDDDIATNAGAAYLVYGPTSGTVGLAGADLKERGGSTGEFFGIEVDMAGDIDGDGLSDLAAGATYADTSETNVGVVYVFASPSSGLALASSDYYARILGDSANDSLGAAMDFGDVNGDGELDLVVGSQYNDDTGTSAGAVWLIYGPISGTLDLTTDADGQWTGTSTNDALGREVAILQDANGDGLDEIAMGAHFADEAGYTERGAVYLWLGE